MKSIFKTGFILTLVALSTTSFAGNKDRAGQAGAGQLLINPWARSAGWAGANSASVTGLEATYTNIAGLAFTPKTELLFANTSPFCRFWYQHSIFWSFSASRRNRRSWYKCSKYEFWRY